MREGSLGEYDFTARRLCSALALWTTPDPVNHHPYNPYGYCAGNPVRYIDPSGMRFTEGSEEFVNQFVTTINQRIERNLRDIASNTVALFKTNEGRAEIEDKLSQLYSEVAQYHDVLNEILVLINSTQVYNIVESTRYCITGSSNGDIITYRGATEYNRKTGEFDVIICFYDVSLMSHELKHAYQFEIGDLSWGYRDKGIPFYDIMDEFEAYKRSILFGYDSGFVSNDYKILQIRPHSVDRDVSKGAPEGTLQNIADRHMCVFRYNGITYVGVGVLEND